MKPSEMIFPVAIAVVIGYFALGWFAARTQSLYVQGCQLKSNSELTPADRNNQNVSDVRATATYCQCMGNSFYLNNGKVRLALLETGLFGVSDIVKPTSDEEAKCGKHAIDQVALEALK